jgi:hypothetical protein
MKHKLPEATEGDPHRSTSYIAGPRRQLTQTRGPDDELPRTARPCSTPRL